MVAQMRQIEATVMRPSTRQLRPTSEGSISLKRSATCLAWDRRHVPHTRRHQQEPSVANLYIPPWNL